MQSTKQSCWVHFCTMTYIHISKICCGSHNKNFNTSPLGSVSGQTNFSFWGHHLAHPLAWLCRIRPLSLRLHLKQGIQNTSYQYWWSKTANSGVYPWDPLGNATVCCDSLSITTSGVYWTMWWLRTKHHIQTVMTQMNYYGHGIHPVVLVKCFRFALKSYFISLTIRCFWHILYLISEDVFMFLI
jgi:hypothetical protein